MRFMPVLSTFLMDFAPRALRGIKNMQKHVVKRNILIKWCERSAFFSPVAGRRVGRRAGWRVGRLAGQLGGWPAGRLVGWLVGWQAGVKMLTVSAFLMKICVYVGFKHILGDLRAPSPSRR